MIIDQEFKSLIPPLSDEDLQRFKKRKTEIDGQMTIVFNGIQFAGYQEVVI